MNTIWKYRLAATYEQEIKVPRGAKLLTAREQHGEICVWALVDDVEPVHESRTIFVHGTGHPVSHLAGEFLGAGHLMGGQLVFHVFEGVR